MSTYGSLGLGAYGIVETIVTPILNSFAKPTVLWVSKMVLIVGVCGISVVPAIVVGVLVLAKLGCGVGVKGVTVSSLRFFPAFLVVALVISVGPPVFPVTPWVAHRI